MPQGNPLTAAVVAGLLRVRMNWKQALLAVLASLSVIASFNIAYALQIPMKIERSFPFGSILNVYDVGIDSNSGLLFFSDDDNHALVAIDMKENHTKSIAIGGYPYRIAVNPATNKVYVTHACNCQAGYSVSVIDFSKGFNGSKVVQIENASIPYSRIAVNQNTNRVYATSSDSITVIDGSADRAIGIINVPASDVAVNYNTNTIYAIDNNDTLYKIDGLTNAIISRITVGSTSYSNTSQSWSTVRPFMLAVNPNTNVAYLLNSIDSSAQQGEFSLSQYHLMAVNGSSNTIINPSITVISGLNTELSMNPNNNRLYVIQGDSEILTLDGRTNQLAYALANPVPPYYRGVVIDTSTNKLYIHSQTGIFQISDSGIAAPEFESFPLAIAFASAVMTILILQKHRKSERK
ncbi:MAG: YncE family protein [Nitrososphaera sp.]